MVTDGGGELQPASESPGREIPVIIIVKLVKYRKRGIVVLYFG
jgi:hypothetical protein